MEKQAHIQQAIRDLQVIRRAIEDGSGGKQQSPTAGVTLVTNLMLQSIALAIAAAILVFEVTTNHMGTQAMLLSVHDYDFALLGVVNVGIYLLLLIASLYFVVYRAARVSKRDFTDYIAAHFVYLDNLSFLSDLAVKFVVFSLLVLAGKPDWVAPVFLLFIGDYLIQGRFFLIPFRSSIALGALCFVGALGLFYFGSPLMAWPTLAASIVCAYSVGYIVHLQKNAPSPADVNAGEQDGN